MKWMGTLFKILIPVLSAILGLVAANKYNFFVTFSFVPAESAYEICITVYFAIADLIISQFVDFIKSKIGNICSKVEVLVSTPHTIASLHTYPTILFNSEGIAEMQVNVNLKGKRTHYKDIKVVIRDTGFITLQPSARTQCVAIAENGDYIIDLYAMIGNGSIIDVNQTFRIVMEENIPDGSRTVKLIPDINKKNLWIKYNCNHAIIKMGEH